MKKTIHYHEDLLNRLKDPPYAREYLNTALEDEDRRVFLLALRDVAEAYGMSRLAAHTRISREHFYRMLSKGGNPQWDTLRKVLAQVGFQFAIIRKPVHRAAA
jgi:probable addiction module antidote protein